jgi:glutaredoxin
VNDNTSKKRVHVHLHLPANNFNMHILFTTQTCPNCPQAKTMLMEQPFSGSLKLINASTADGLTQAQQYAVCQVPTLIETDDDGKELKRYAGLSEISDTFS